MAFEPVLYKDIRGNYLDITVDIKLDYNIIALWGDSGVGKTLLAEMLRSFATDYNIKVFDYRDYGGRALTDFKSIVKNGSGYLIVIDNADLLLDEQTKVDLCKNDKNQYIIIGRNIEGLYLRDHNIKEVDFHNKIISLKDI